MPLSMPLGEHPDGDPFAAEDRRRFEESAIGRLEQRALAEAQQQAGSPRGELDDDEEDVGGNATGIARNDRDSSTAATSSADFSDAASQPGAGSDAGDDESGDEDEEGGDESGAGSNDGEDDESGEDDEDDDEDSEDDDEDDDDDDDDKMDVDLTAPEARPRNKHLDGATSPTSAPSSPLSNVSGPDNDLDTTRMTDAAEVAVAAASGEPSSEARVNGSPVKASGSQQNGVSSSMPQHRPSQQPNGSASDTAPLKKQKRRRGPLRTPSPGPAPPPKLETMRFDIALPRWGASGVALAASAARAPPTMVDVEGLVDDKLGRSRASQSPSKGKAKALNGTPLEAGAGSDAPPPKKRRRRVQARDEGYDEEDPFVDNSDLAVLEPKFFARPKREGFFIAQGTVEVAKKRRGGRKTTEDGAPTNPTIPAATKLKGDGTKASPLVIGDDDDRPQFGGGGGGLTAEPAAPKPPKKGEISEFSTAMQEELRMLQDEVKKESFEPKNKFPPRLKPILLDVVDRAIRWGELDDGFFLLMPRIFPYNHFTMKKLIKRESFNKHVDILNEEKAEQFRILDQGIAEEMPTSQEEYEASLAEYNARESERAQQQSDAAAASTPAGGSPAATPAPTIGAGPTEDGEAKAEDSPAPGDAPAKKKKALPGPPKKRCKLSGTMKMALSKIVEIEDEKVELENTKNEMEKKADRVSSLSARKKCYAEIVSHFPDGWMDSSTLGRHVSIAKRKKD